ncbi:CCR4-NOT transcription complex subunit 4 [Camellia lanceoleosa]|uniref:CCR4-NOT transcription complex subunit 4 n=1 Tax=Camellia lanceoleosa TaxID=1840588 RepID=A0ACC0HC93_9ERIC|nr:CCR4-NOT transcription complex subunit 4 [Camellia lanceoleosa]
MTDMNLEGCALDGAEGPQWMEAWEPLKVSRLSKEIIKVSSSYHHSYAITGFKVYINHDKVDTCESSQCEMNMGRKVKPQKAKGKTSEGRKQLSSVRVIQRNLVYIVGLPLNLADEDQREYFGQYGKVLKVSISRTSGGAIQHFDNTCSVYIPYSKEEEAVQCIQSVYGFTLDGRSLRACFGTTKYCHAWLRNVSCSNPDCLYLHEIGTQEDSFTKDGIISAYTRNVCVCELNLIWRETNIYADLLAENAAAQRETFMLIHDAPKTLLTLLAKDRIGVGCLTRVHS